MKRTSNSEGKKKKEEKTFELSVVAFGFLIE